MINEDTPDDFLAMCDLGPGYIRRLARACIGMPGHPAEHLLRVFSISINNANDEVVVTVLNGRGLIIHSAVEGLAPGNLIDKFKRVGNETRDMFVLRVIHWLYSTYEVVTIRDGHYVSKTPCLLVASEVVVPSALDDEFADFDDNGIKIVYANVPRSGSVVCGVDERTDDRNDAPTREGHAWSEAIEAICSHVAVGDKLISDVRPNDLEYLSSELEDDVEYVTSPWGGKDVELVREPKGSVAEILAQEATRYCYISDTTSKGIRPRDDAPKRLAQRDLFYEKLVSKSDDPESEGLWVLSTFDIVLSPCGGFCTATYHPDTKISVRASSKALPKLVYMPRGEGDSDARLCSKTICHLMSSWHFIGSDDLCIVVNRVGPLSFEDARVVPPRAMWQLCGDALRGKCGAFPDVSVLYARDSGSKAGRGGNSVRYSLPVWMKALRDAKETDAQVRHGVFNPFVLFGQVNPGDMSPLVRISDFLPNRVKGLRGVRILYSHHDYGGEKKVEVHGHPIVLRDADWGFLRKWDVPSSRPKYCYAHLSEWRRLVPKDRSLCTVVVLRGGVWNSGELRVYAVPIRKLPLNWVELAGI